MTDSGMKGRVRGLLGGPVPANAPADQQLDGHAPEPLAEHHALQVLTLAQRTAEQHMADARRQADKVAADARAAATQIVKDAKAHADKVQRQAEQMLAHARAQADELAKTAQESADELRHQAEQRYEDVVGGLAARREALQRQIEALEQFDQDYRSRLSAYLQHQLRSLWVDEPQVNAAALEEPDEQ